MEKSSLVDAVKGFIVTNVVVEWRSYEMARFFDVVIHMLAS